MPKSRLQTEMKQATLECHSQLEQNAEDVTKLVDKRRPRALSRQIQRPDSGKGCVGLIGLTSATKEIHNDKL